MNRFIRLELIYQPSVASNTALKRNHIQQFRFNSSLIINCDIHKKIV